MYFGSFAATRLCCGICIRRRYFCDPHASSPPDQEHPSSRYGYLRADFHCDVQPHLLFFSDSWPGFHTWLRTAIAICRPSIKSPLWSGQEGSLLFWSFLLAIYVFSALFAYRNKNGELMPYVGVVLAGVQIFFLTLNNFV